MNKMLFLKRNLNFNQLYKCDVSEELIGPGDYYYEDDQDGFIVKAEVYKELKNRTPIGSAIDKKLYEELKQYSKDTGVPMSKLLDRAISLLLESAKK